MRTLSLHAAVRAELSLRLSAAMKTRDRVAVDALRAVLGALDNATAVARVDARTYRHDAPAEVPRRELARRDIEVLILTEADNRSVAASEYERLGHSDRARRLRHEAAIVRSALANLAALDAGDAG